MWRTHGLPGAGAVVVLLVAGLSGAITTPPAAAAPGDNPWATPAGDGYSGTARSVTVTSTFGGTRATRSVPAPLPACRWWPGSTATEFVADHVVPGGLQYDSGFDWTVGLVELPGGGWVPPDHQERLAAEAASASPVGQYWYPGCYSGDFPGSVAEFFEYADQFFLSSPPYQYWLTGTAPPVPPLGVTELLDIATEYIEAPDPDVGVNPAAFSLVNLDTWVWAQGDTFTPGTILAESGLNWVQIDVTPQRLQLSAPNARQSAPCADGGTPWSPAADEPTCAVTFTRAPVGRATLPLTVSSLWTARWSASDGTSGAGLPGTTATTVVDVAVQEVQTVVTDVT